jgi:hypothetical protein
MAYSNQCNFMKVSGDDGNPATAPDIIDVDPTSGAANYSPSHQPTTLPTRDRSHTGPYLPSHGLAPTTFSAYGPPPPEMDTGSSNDLSGTSPDGNGRTPNSSTTGGTSDPQRQTLAPTTGNGHVNGGSGRNSFETSPALSHHNINSMPGTTPSDVERNVNPFFPADPPFGMSAGVSTGLAPDQRFNMAATGDTPSSRGPGGSAASGDGTGEFSGHTAPTWADMPGQQGMTPVAEGVLRSIMGMGPIDGMDMGWEPSG